MFRGKVLGVGSDSLRFSFSVSTRGLAHINNHLYILQVSPWQHLKLIQTWNRLIVELRTFYKDLLLAVGNTF